MKNNLLFTIILLTAAYSSSLMAQGCVAIRGNTSCGGSLENSLNLQKGSFNDQAGIRYFKSFRHFRGSLEETNRIEEGTEVVSKSTFLDFAVNYGITDRLYANIVLPIVFHNRSSMYEHGGNPPNGLRDRHETSSNGNSDVRLGLGYWLFDPEKHNFNYAVGVGIKLPTGSYDYTDTFYNQGDEKNQSLTAVVDQSIQPGDGGYGIALDMQGFHPLSAHIGVVSNLYYLLNVQETNGVLIRNGNSEFSCPDQFAVRLGSFYDTMKGFNFYLGGRVEGVTASDLIGGDGGYRRPGYAISVEPGVGYSHDHL